jgi:hypothetical protein
MFFFLTLAPPPVDYAPPPAFVRVQDNPREIRADRTKVLELCATENYDSIVTVVEGLNVRFFCDPFMPPLLLHDKSGAPGREETSKRGQPYQAPDECHATDKAYGLCEMSKLQRDLRDMMLKVEEKRAEERRKEQAEAAERAKRPAAPAGPTCIDPGTLGMAPGIPYEVLGAGTDLVRVFVMEKDVRLLFRIKRPPLYGPLIGVKEDDILSVDVLEARAVSAVPVVANLDVNAETVAKLCRAKEPVAKSLVGKPVTDFLAKVKAGDRPTDLDAPPPQPKPDCLTPADLGFVMGRLYDMGGTQSKLISTLPTAGDLRLTFRVERAAAGGPFAGVKAGQLIQLDALGSRNKYPYELLPVRIERAHLQKLCK